MPNRLSVLLPELDHGFLLSCFRMVLTLAGKLLCHQQQLLPEQQEKRSLRQGRLMKNRKTGNRERR